jgi:hypothetical protein
MGCGTSSLSSEELAIKNYEGFVKHHEVKLPIISKFTSTINAKSLSDEDYNKFALCIKCRKNEIILFVNANVSVNNFVHICKYNYLGCTNKRIFLLRINRTVLSIKLKHIKWASYINNIMSVRSNYPGNERNYTYKLDITGDKSGEFFCDYIISAITHRKTNLGLKNDTEEKQAEKFNQIIHEEKPKQIIHEEKSKQIIHEEKPKQIIHEEKSKQIIHEEIILNKDKLEEPPPYSASV